MAPASTGMVSFLLSTVTSTTIAVCAPGITRKSVPAAVHAMLGEKYKGFELLNLGFKQRATGMMMIRWDPPFDPLRSDLRFQSLCRKLGFPRSRQHFSEPLPW
jgi:hypothetical protein